MVNVKELHRLKSRYNEPDDTVYSFPADQEVDLSEYQEILPRRRGKLRFFYRRPMTNTNLGHTSKKFE